MNARTLQVMTIVALGAAGAAWYVSRTTSSSAAKAASNGALFFPELAAKSAAVQSILVQSKGQSFTLQKQGDTWGMTDKGGYAVNFDKVKDLVSKLAYFAVLEKKTDSPELFGKLELEDAGAEGTKSTRVTLSDASGTALADILLGKNASGGGPGLSSMYVRRPGENQTYEVNGSVYIDGTASNWLDKQIVKLERARVHRAETLRGDGERLLISKASPDEKNFSVQDLPAGAELKWPGVADGIAGAMEYLNFDDVQAAGAVDFGAPQSSTMTLRTFDGLEVTVKVIEQEGKFYAQFGARFDPSLRVEVVKYELPQVGPELPATDPAADPAAAQPVETRSVPGKSAEEVAKEAAELSERFSKWTYVLPGYAASNFSKSMGEMLKEVGPPLGPVIGDGDVDGGDEGGIQDPTEVPPAEVPPPPTGGGQ